MFCSKCGKSIDLKEQLCPSCGNPIGESHMDGFTSVQRIYAPGESAPEKNKYTPYTRLSYSTSEGVEEEDVYSRTTYRPVLKEEEGPQSEQEEAPVPQEEASEEEMPVSESAPAEEEPEEDEEPLEPIELPELKKAVKKGISADLEEYMRQLQEDKKPSKRSDFVKNLLDRGKDEEEEDEEETSEETENTETEAETAEEPEEEEKPKRAARRSERKKKKKKKKKAATGKWIKIGVCVLIVAALVAGGVLLVDTIVNSSQIKGVTKEFREQGIALLESHTSDEYRKNAILLYQQDETATLLLQQQLEDQELYRDLMPEEPLENDEVFLEALLSIQDSIDNATMVDAIIQASDDNATLKAQSAQSWSAIDTAISKLKVCSDVEELSTIMAEAVQAVATPTPDATPEPEAEYETLSKGMKSSAVKALQNRLYELGYFNSKRDGAYGDVTKRAVKQFQEAAGLTANGVADSATQELLYSEDAPKTGVKADTEETATEETTESEETTETEEETAA